MFEKTPDCEGGEAGVWDPWVRGRREPGAQTPESEGRVARGFVHTRHPVVTESPVWVRRRRSRLRARCEGGADGEEEGVGRGPSSCQIPDLRRNHHHGDRGRQRGPSPTLSGPGNEFFLPRRVPVQTTSPSGRWTSPFASEGPLTPRAAGSCSSLRQRA